MIHPSTKTACAVGLLLSLHAAGMGQEKAATSSKPSSLESAASEVTRLDDSMQKYLAAFLTVVEGEAAAKRISDLEAGELRWTGQSIAPPLNGDARVLLATAFLPSESEALVKAINDFAGEADRATTQREALLAAAIGEMRTRIREIVAHSAKSEEVEPLLRALRALAFQAGTHVLMAMDSKARAFAGGAAFLETFCATLDAMAGNDANAVEAGVRELTAFSRTTPESAASDDAVRQIRAIQAPLLAAVENAQDDLQSALIKRKSGPEISDALAKLEGAIRSYTPAGFAPKLRAYRALATLAGRGKKADVGAVRQSIEQARAALSSSTLEDSRKAALQDLLAKWELDKQETVASGGKDIRQEAALKIKEATKPADLEALAVELGSLRSEAPRPRGRLADSEPSDLTQLAYSLSAMAAAWSAGNLGFMSSFTDFTDGGVQGLSKELAELRSRITRDILCQTLNATELKKPPLADLPLDKALPDLTVALAEKGEWRRVLKLFEVQNLSSRRGEGGPSQADSANSVASFLAGQNFELAGEWRLAANAYKNVLRAAAEVSPIKETAGRLKALMKEHPEAFAKARRLPRDPSSD